MLGWCQALTLEVEDLVMEPVPTSDDVLEQRLNHWTGHLHKVNAVALLKLGLEVTASGSGSKIAGADVAKGVKNNREKIAN